jgi:hypothetical protein
MLKMDQALLDSFFWPTVEGEVNAVTGGGGGGPGKELETVAGPHNLVKLFL